VETLELTLTEIQYLRSLILQDQICGDFLINPQIKIDRQTSMYDFTEKIMKKLNDMEDDFVGE
jgi:hypothetical protein